MKTTGAISFHKTRIAPTPSGFLHVGNASSFMITAALAEETNAKLLLRIDDLDRDRVEEAYVKDIFETLHFLEITWDEGPQNYEEYQHTWSQMQRLALYNAALEQLQQSGHLFACTCSRTQVLKDSPDGSYPGTCRHKKLPLNTPGANWRVSTELPRATELIDYLPSRKRVIAIINDLKAFAGASFPGTNGKRIPNAFVVVDGEPEFEG